MRNKLQRFADNAQDPKVIAPGKPIYENIKGNWHATQFENNHPITLEVGCGRADYTLGLAKLFPQRNCIGIDIKGSRIWSGAQVAKELENVAFLRTKIEHLDSFFAENEVAEIYIPFPDPRPKDRDEKRRLTSPRFLDIYKRILQPEGIVHLKTDNLPLFEYTLEVLDSLSIQPLASTTDLYNSDYVDQHHGIQTAYEKRFLAEGITIKYLKFAF